MSTGVPKYRELAAKCSRLLQQESDERYRSVLRRAAAKLNELADTHEGERVRLGWYSSPSIRAGDAIEPCKSSDTRSERLCDTFFDERAKHEKPRPG
jgi:hypothetical protein